MRRRGLSEAFSPNVSVINTRTHLSELCDHLEMRKKTEMEDGGEERRARQSVGQREREMDNMNTSVSRGRPTEGGKR